MPSLRALAQNEMLAASSRLRIGSMISFTMGITVALSVPSAETTNHGNADASI